MDLARVPRLSECVGRTFGLFAQLGIPFALLKELPELCKQRIPLACRDEALVQQVEQLLAAFPTVGHGGGVTRAILRAPTGRGYKRAVHPHERGHGEVAGRARGGIGKAEVVGGIGKGVGERTGP